MSIRFNNDRFSPYTLLRTEYSTSCHLHESQGRSATHKYFQVISGIHDIDKYFIGSVDLSDLLFYNVQIFICHWGHSAMIFVWLSSNLFHIGSVGNYEVYYYNPIKTPEIGHGISDPHFPERDRCVLSGVPIYNSLYSSGLVSTSGLYNFVIFVELIGIHSITSGKMRCSPWAALDKSDGYYSYPFGLVPRTALARFLLLSKLSVLWSRHLEGTAIPLSRGLSYGPLSVGLSVEPFHSV